MSSDQHEIEWQFDAGDLEAVAHWLLVHAPRDGLTVIQGDTKELSDAYFDTADWRIYNAGYALRVRCISAQATGGGTQSIKSSHAEATLKALAPAVKGIRRRRELSESLVLDSKSQRKTLQMLRQATGEVGRRAHALCGTHAIVQLFEARTTRRTYNLLVDGAQAGEVVLDETRLLSGGHGKDLAMQRVEVEVVTSPEMDTHAATAHLRAFVKQLRKACNLQPAEQSKYESGLALRNLAPASLATADYGPTRFSFSSTMGELALAVMRRSFTALAGHEPGVRLGDELKEVHAMRVATRRLRAAMSLFEDALPPRAAALHEELGWLAAGLGAVRDMDVEIAQVNGWISDANADDSVSDADPLTQSMALRKVGERLSDQRASAHRSLVEQLDSRRYERLIDDLAKLLRQAPRERPDPAAVRRASGNDVSASIPNLVAERYKKVIKLCKQLGPASPPSDYHRARIMCKRLRYPLEFVSKLYGKPAKTLLKRAIALQDTLGLYQDAQVAISRLNAMGADSAHPLAPEDEFARQVAIRRYEQMAAEVRQQVPGVFARLQGKAWKELRKALARQAKHKEPAAR